MSTWANAKKAVPNAKELESLFDRLWPICRSLTGEGFRRSLQILSETMPLEKVEVPTGTPVLDWTVPREWNISEAYLEDESGRRWVDFAENNLHVLNYSVPTDQWLNRSELDSHLYSLPEMPDAIPYVTSYYAERWGFCLSEKQRLSLPKTGKFHAVIRSELKSGSLTYGHLLLPATVPTDQEILISTYLCHPSMANNELSGPMVAQAIYQGLKSVQDRRYNYRFVVIPETIGAITYLAKYGEHLKKNCRAGLVVTCVGDGRATHYKRSRRGNALIDQVAEFVLSRDPSIREQLRVMPFFPTGSDERQYCSPGFDLPVGSITRSMYGKYPEYHTSLDNKDFVDFFEMKHSAELYLDVLEGFELNQKYLNLAPHGEPMLSKRNLYNTLGANRVSPQLQQMIAYLLAYSDGDHSVLDIAKMANMDLAEFREPIRLLTQAALLKEI